MKTVKWLLIFFCLECSGVEKTDSVVSISKKLGRDIIEKGSLEYLAEKNKFDLQNRKVSQEEFFKSLSIDYKVELVEGYTMMRWSVRRFRISEKYELLLQIGLNEKEREVIIEAAVIPFKDVKYKANLLDRKKWKHIKFE